ncbi:MAG: hypothetical protein ACTSYD_04685 [Candidatus Heimdallarchaeaceae archaeon]
MVQSKGTLKRTSTLFRKLHFIIAFPSRAIYSLSLILVVTLTIDSKVFGILWQKLPSPILDLLPSTVLNTLYIPLICYNYRLLLQNS